MNSGRLGTLAALSAIAVAVTFTLGVDVINAMSPVVLPAGADYWVPYQGWVSLLAGVPHAVLGILLLRTRPRHAVAWLLTLSGMAWLLDAMSGSWVRHAMLTGYDQPGVLAAIWLLDRFGSLLIPLTVATVLLFPDGRLPRHRFWRWLSLAGIGLTLLLPFAALTAPAAMLNRVTGAPALFDGPVTPDVLTLPLPYQVWELLYAVGLPALYLGMVIPFAVSVHRYRRAGGEVRAQIRWLVWAVLVSAIVPIAGEPLPEPLRSGSLTGSFGLVAVAIAFAVMRHRLYAIDRLLPATAVYGALAVSFIVVDALVITVAGQMIDERGAALTAMAAVSAGYLLGRDFLWRWARRLLLGARVDSALVATLARRLETASGVEMQLTELAGALAHAFRLGFVAIRLQRLDGTLTTVVHGAATEETIVLPVAYRGEPIGQLQVVRRDGARLSDRDQRMLGDLVRQAAAATRATDINVALERARTELVLGREDERRRLRRDLHDGLGPSIGAVQLRIETARNLAASRPEAVDGLLASAARDIGAILDEIRRVVYELRPPALDELGLVRAVQQHADAMQTAECPVEVNAAEPLPVLPAAVEVAAYRIVSEALANVVRHAGATRCAISMSTSVDRDELLIEVSDNGRGMAPDRAPGVGLIAMRERAGELGGRCAVESTGEGGTLVRCRLPLSRADIDGREESDRRVGV
ncbi:ATP-binding protein [Couchioplanes azureus]|uniref:ATP-binding protein n=1 Tax=Couchioplanes caeruleus TaxID=56438 RepID=UPI00166FF6E5|nr:ATP-binding protein [Couchioplanes caeruleus]